MVNKKQDSTVPPISRQIVASNACEKEKNVHIRELDDISYSMLSITFSYVEANNFLREKI